MTRKKFSMPPGVPTTIPLHEALAADDAVAGANGTERSEAPAAAERLAVDAQTLFAVLVDKQAWCAIPKGRLDVVLPKI